MLVWYNFTFIGTLIADLFAFLAFLLADLFIFTSSSTFIKTFVNQDLFDNHHILDF